MIMVILKQASNQYSEALLKKLKLGQIASDLPSFLFRYLERLLFTFSFMQKTVL